MPSIHYSGADWDMLRAYLLKKAQKQTRSLATHAGDKHKTEKRGGITAGAAVDLLMQPRARQSTASLLRVIHAKRPSGTPSVSVTLGNNARNCIQAQSGLVYDVFEHKSRSHHGAYME